MEGDSRSAQNPVSSDRDPPNPHVYVTLAPPLTDRDDRPSVKPFQSGLHGFFPDPPNHKNIYNNPSADRKLRGVGPRPPARSEEESEESEINLGGR